jgi:uncharacterized protein
MLTLVGTAPLAGEPTPLDALKSECSKGKLASCVALADTLEPSDPVQAAKLYGRACQGAVGIACDTLGTMYQLGNGVDPDDQKALASFRKACDAKYADGCYHLGQLYFDGRGVEQNIKTVVALYTKSCDLGSADPCDILGGWYEGGGIVGRDPLKAAVFFKKMCANSEPDDFRCRRALGDQPK